MPTLAFLGDVMLGRGVNDEYLRGKRPARYWGTALPALQRVDAVIANLECVMTRCQQRWWKTPKVFHFRAEVAAIDILRAANVRCVTLANNHVLDFTEAGLEEMLNSLDRAEIAHAGAGNNRAAAEAPAVINVGGVHIGVISFTDHPAEFAASEHQPGVNLLKIDPSDIVGALERLDGWIDAAKSLGAQIVALAPHWGPNMRAEPPPEFLEFAHQAVKRGVDLVVGHSAHVFQGIDVHHGKLICYDAGDALDDYMIDDVLHNDWSFILLFDIDSASASITRLRLIPLQLTYAEMHLADGDIRRMICSRMIERSAAFGTRLLVTDEGLELAPATAPR
jgi:poly-gamma-glutamate capsule biosynthesis protein CapA/YwtB (metallophosphatase superfamily)